jgi:hypothetical protein
MIWNEQREAKAPDELAAFLEAELAGAALERPEAAGEIAGAVEAFVRDQHPWETLPSEYLLLLVARSLWAVGEEAAVRRLIADRGAEWRVAPVFAGAALAADLSVPHWGALLGSRTVQTGSSAARGAIWLVDVQRLVEPGRGGLELTVFRALNAVLDRMAGVWDDSGGQGILGLRNLEAAAGAVLGDPRRSRKRAALVREFHQRCEQRLRLQGPARGWRAVPEVIRL